MPDNRFVSIRFPTTSKLSQLGSNIRHTSTLLITLKATMEQHQPPGALQPRAAPISQSYKAAHLVESGIRPARCL